jgi:hypothetical protein
MAIRSISNCALGSCLFLAASRATAQVVGGQAERAGLFEFSEDDCVNEGKSSTWEVEPERGSQGLVDDARSFVRAVTPNESDWRSYLDSRA